MSELKDDGTSPLASEMPTTGEDLENNQVDQLSDMLSDFIAPEVKSEDSDPTLDPPGVRPDLKKTEDKVEKDAEERDTQEGAEQEELSSEQESAEESGEEEERSTEEEVTDFQLDELSQLRLQVELLQEQISKGTTTKEAKTAVEQTPTEVVNELLTDDEANNIALDPKGTLIKLATRLHDRISQDIQAKIPDLVQGTHQRQTALNDARVHFATTNPELATVASKNTDVQNLIRVTANKIAADEPALTPIEVFDKTAERVSRTIGLARKAKETEMAAKTTSQPKKPRSKTRGQSGKEDQRTETQKQIADLLDL